MKYIHNVRPLSSGSRPNGNHKIIPNNMFIIKNVFIYPPSFPFVYVANIVNPFGYRKGKSLFVSGVFPTLCLLP